MALVILIFKLFFLVSLVSSKVTLENSGFESPPTNITKSTTSQFILLDTNNVIPGWSFNGTVWYVTAGENISLPGNGHALQLGPNGMINQTFKPDGSYDYVLTFTLASSSPDCANNFTAVNISGPSASQVFYFKESLGTQMWQTYAYSLWSQENQNGLMSLQIQSTNSNNITCWPIVDSVLVTGIDSPRLYSDNGFVNRGFEVGPAFIGNSSEGVLIEADWSYPVSSIQSPLQYWTILGIVKYIDSKHYAVPRGRGAVELLSGNPSGIVSDVIFLKRGQVTLDFIMGDANDSCVGNFIVFLQVGDMIWNFTMSSVGVGSREKHSVTFKAEFSKSETVPISFVSFNETRTINHQQLCGPVIDSTYIRFSSERISNHLPSDAYKHEGFVVFSFVLVLAFFLFIV